MVLAYSALRLAPGYDLSWLPSGCHFTRRLRGSGAWLALPLGFRCSVLGAVARLDIHGDLRRWFACALHCCLPLSAVVAALSVYFWSLVFGPIDALLPSLLGYAVRLLGRFLPHTEAAAGGDLPRLGLSLLLPLLTPLRAFSRLRSPLSSFCASSLALFSVSGFRAPRGSVSSCCLSFLLHIRSYSASPFWLCRHSSSPEYVVSLFRVFRFAISFRQVVCFFAHSSLFY